MSAEVYLGCEGCRTAYHIGYIVTIHSNFVLDRDLSERLLALQEFIHDHSYCGPDGGLSFPRIMWEGHVDEDTWKLIR